jgi:hypothetical protein
MKKEIPGNLTRKRSAQLPLTQSEDALVERQRLIYSQSEKENEY